VKVSVCSKRASVCARVRAIQTEQVSVCVCVREGVRKVRVNIRVRERVRKNKRVCGRERERLDILKQRK